MPTYRFGSTGDGVRLVQALLDMEKADGIYGSRTVSAVKAFQKSAGLQADGVVGRDTWAALITKYADARAKIRACMLAIEKLPEFKALDGVI